MLQNWSGSCYLAACTLQETMHARSQCMAVWLTDTLLWPMQVSEARALERTVAAESSNAQLIQQAEDHQRQLQELCNSRNAAASLCQQALQTAMTARNLAEVRLCALCLWCALWCMIFSVICSHIPCGLPHLHLDTVLDYSSLWLPLLPFY